MNIITYKKFLSHKNNIKRKEFVSNIYMKNIIAKHILTHINTHRVFISINQIY